MSRGAGHIYAHDRGPWWLYVIHEEDGEAGPVKIGSAANPAYRLSSLVSGNPRRLVMAHTVKIATRGDALIIEQQVLKSFKERRLPGRDWIRCSVDEAHEAILAAIGGAS